MLTFLIVCGVFGLLCDWGLFSGRPCGCPWCRAARAEVEAEALREAAAARRWDFE